MPTNCDLVLTRIEGTKRDEETLILTNNLIQMLVLHDIVTFIHTNIPFPYTYKYTFPFTVSFFEPPWFGPAASLQLESLSLLSGMWHVRYALDVTCSHVLYVKVKSLNILNICLRHWIPCTNVIGIFPKYKSAHSLNMQICSRRKIPLMLWENPFTDCARMSTLFTS